MTTFALIRLLRPLLVLWMLAAFAGAASAVEFSVNPIADIRMQSGSTVFEGQAYFSSGGNVHVSDGHTVRQLTGLAPQDESLSAHSYTANSSDVFFVGSDWMSSGLRTERLFAVNGGNPLPVSPLGLDVSSPTEFRDEIYFNGSGTETGLYRMADDGVTLLSNVSKNSYFHEYGDSSLFIGFEPVIGRSLYKLEGDDVSLVADTNSNGDMFAGNFGWNLVDFGDDVFFTAEGPVGQELYKTDGSEAVLVADINPAGDSTPSDYFEFMNELFFVANGPTGRELYKTDGTSTSIVADLNPVGDSSPRIIGELSNRLVFSAFNGTELQLFSSDGVNVEVVEGFNSTGVENVFSMGNVGGGVVLSVRGESNQAVFTDGLIARTVADEATVESELFPCFVGDCPPQRLYGLGYEYAGHLLFGAQGENGLAVFSTDGKDVNFVSEETTIDPIFFPPKIDLEGAILFAGGGSSPGVYRLNLTGDFDSNVELGLSDIILLSAAIREQSNESLFDLDGDELVDTSDLMVWTEGLLGTVAGDTDLDSDVEFNDFLSLAAGFGMSGEWQNGDFDANGIVEFPDFLLLAQNFGFKDSTTESVPEPTSLWLLVSGFAYSCLVRRERWSINQNE